MLRDLQARGCCPSHMPTPPAIRLSAGQSSRETVDRAYGQGEVLAFFDPVDYGSEYLRVDVGDVVDLFRDEDGWTFAQKSQNSETCPGWIPTAYFKYRTLKMRSQETPVSNTEYQNLEAITDDSQVVNSALLDTASEALALQLHFEEEQKQERSRLDHNLAKSLDQEFRSAPHVDVDKADCGQQLTDNDHEIKLYFDGQQPDVQQANSTASSKDPILHQAEEVCCDIAHECSQADRSRVVARFDARQYGHEYVSLEEGEIVTVLKADDGDSRWQHVGVYDTVSRTTDIRHEICRRHSQNIKTYFLRSIPTLDKFILRHKYVKRIPNARC